MRCFRCQKFGHTQQTRISNLVCGDCDEIGHEDGPCPGPLNCISYWGAHASGDRDCPLYREEMVIQELRNREGLSFLDVRKTFLETKS
jgi:hypothetical protein